MNIVTFYFDFDKLQFVEGISDEPQSNPTNELTTIENGPKETTARLDFVYEYCERNFNIIVIVDKNDRTIYNDNNKFIKLSSRSELNNKYFRKSGLSDRTSFIGYKLYINNEFVQKCWSVDEYTFECIDPTKIMKGYEISYFEIYTKELYV
jgi:hypothetical protein